VLDPAREDCPEKLLVLSHSCKRKSNDSSGATSRGASPLTK
jgi:hypothetical protein